tara:strand:+ start:407 stop:565 length:159 start_codon:yes stop_codon:yes gene_type:complete
MKKLEKLLKHLQKLALKKKRKPAFLLASQKKITKNFHQKKRSLLHGISLQGG